METKDPCVHCGKSTVFGSGRFVNRIPSDDGYSCANCLAIDCDRCGDPIPLDEDCFLDEWGEQRAHYECLTAEEKAKHNKDNNDE